MGRSSLNTLCGCCFNFPFPNELPWYEIEVCSASSAQLPLRLLLHASLGRSLILPRPCRRPQGATVPLQLAPAAFARVSPSAVPTPLLPAVRPCSLRLHGRNPEGEPAHLCRASCCPALRPVFPREKRMNGCGGLRFKDRDLVTGPGLPRW